MKEKYLEQWHQREANKWHYVVPGGESYSLVASRAEKWLLSLPEQVVIIAVSHEMIGRVIRGVYLGLDEQQTLMKKQRNNEIILLAGYSEQILKV